MTTYMRAYDPRRTSLYTPYVEPTVFTAPVPAIDAGICAELSRMAYIPFENGWPMLNRLRSDLLKAGITLEGQFNEKGTQAFVASLGTQLVVAFRGTQPDLADFATDLDTWRVGFGQIPGCEVHAGFKHAFDVIWPHIQEEFGDRLNSAIFTGHSLGAALATLAAYAVMNQPPPTATSAKLMTFGSPAVGNNVFATNLSSVSAQRYINCCDVITRIPPLSLGFEHVGTPNYIDKNGRIGVITTPAAENKDQVTARADYLLQYAWRIGTVILRDLADHSPINYYRAL